MVREQICAFPSSEQPASGVCFLLLFEPHLSNRGVLTGLGKVHDDILVSAAAQSNLIQITITEAMTSQVSGLTLKRLYGVMACSV